MFGTFLTWMNDHTSDVFLIATCNDISSLPPEFARAERWDAVFFMDLPDDEEKQAIWSIYNEMYRLQEMPQNAGFNLNHIAVDDTDWTGAEIKACCRLSALMGISVEESADFIVPVARTAESTITSLRRWAADRAIAASYPGRYRGPSATTKTSPGKRRVAKAR